MRRSFLLCVLFSSISSICYAQQVGKGTIEISGSTAVLINRQTLSPEGSNGKEDATLTNATIGVDLTGYISSHVGVGALVSYTSLSLKGADNSEPLNAHGGFFGPAVKARFGLGPSASFVVIGSAGVDNTYMKSSNGIDDVDASGFYWLAGGGVSVALKANASFDFGVRYQDSNYKASGSKDKTKAAGLLVGAGFTVYLGHRP